MRRQGSATNAGRAFVLLCLTIAISCSPAGAAVRIVRPGESIQAAIDRSEPGDVVRLEPGSYRENVSIRRGPLTLEGPGTMLMPTVPRLTPCDPYGLGSPGVCVFGRDAARVRLSKLTVTGFNGSGVSVVGVRRFRADHNIFSNNRHYGIFAFASRAVQYSDNAARANGEAGFYLGESPKAAVHIVRNRALANRAPGILLRSSSVGTVARNRVVRNCIGIMVLGDAPGKASAFTIAHNRVIRNRRRCHRERDDYIPRSHGIGIALVAARRVRVIANRVLHNGGRPTNPRVLTGGLWIGRGAGGTSSTHNVVSRNRLIGNEPFDLASDGLGRNRFADNHCRRVRAPGICR
jgi:hypothetical protein